MISDFFELVKKYDEEFNQPCSFVVNEDGIPEVVYHGTGRADRVNMVFDMLTKGVSEKVELPKFIPVDTENVVKVVTISA